MKFSYECIELIPKVLVTVSFTFSSFTEGNLTYIYSMEVAFFMSDCCQPRSRQILDIQRHVTSLTSNSPRYELSLNSSILLGLLEKDFSHVIACPVRTIVSHIKESGISLPQNAAALLHISSSSSSFPMLQSSSFAQSIAHTQSSVQGNFCRNISVLSSLFGTGI